MKIWSCQFKDKDGNSIDGYATEDWLNKHKSEAYNGLVLQSATLIESAFTLNIAQLLLKGVILSNTSKCPSDIISKKNNTNNEDSFLLDYIEWQEGNIHISDYAKKYNMTVWELQDKLRENRFAISNIRR